VVSAPIENIRRPAAISMCRNRKQSELVHPCLTGDSFFSFSLGIHAPNSTRW